MNSISFSRKRYNAERPAQGVVEDFIVELEDVFENFDEAAQHEDVHVRQHSDGIVEVMLDTWSVAWLGSQAFIETEDDEAFATEDFRLLASARRLLVEVINSGQTHLQL